MFNETEINRLGWNISGKIDADSHLAQVRKSPGKTIEMFLNP